MSNSAQIRATTGGTSLYDLAVPAAARTLVLFSFASDDAKVGEYYPNQLVCREHADLVDVLKLARRYGRVGAGRPTNYFCELRRHENAVAEIALDKSSFDFLTQLIEHLAERGEEPDEDDISRYLKELRDAQEEK